MSEFKEETLVKNLANQYWRLNNLYWIISKKATRVKLRMNWAQEQFWNEISCRHLVLKARQLGLSTFIDILALDLCLFRKDFRAVIIAHDKQSAEELFYYNVWFPYNNLPESLKSNVKADTHRTNQLRFSNNSAITVMVSARSGMVPFLHVSEFGKICAQYPQKAQEIVSGSFEAVPQDGVIVIESTAEGEEGYFHDYVTEAHKAQQMGIERSPNDWRLTFLPWWKHPEYVSDPTKERIPKQLEQYFHYISAKYNISPGPARKAWYAWKWRQLGNLMKREHPSTVEEAFEVSLEGTYFAEQVAWLRRNGRITNVPYQDGSLVETWWDIGTDDETVIWFVQRIGKEYHVIDHYHNDGVGIQHYAQMLAEKKQDDGYFYGKHIGPPDLAVREWGKDAQRRVDTARQLGIDFTIVDKHNRQDRIEAVRNFLKLCWFDETRTSKGLSGLTSYRRQWDEKKAKWKDEPFHDWASNHADAFGYGVMGQGAGERVPARKVARTQSRWA